MAHFIQIKRGTAAIATSNNVTLLDGEMGYETDTGKFKVGDGVTAWNSLGYLAAGPTGPAGADGADGDDGVGWPAIGDLYWRLPGEALPATKYGGTWSNVSSTWAGSFFRVEGGDASTYDSGVQAAAVLSHEHTGSMRGNNTGAGWAFGQQSSGVTSLVKANMQSGTWSLGYTSTEGDSDGRPVNETIQIWRRTA